MPFRRAAIVLLVGIAVRSIVSAQTSCDSVGPDLIIGDLTGPANYTSQNGIEAFAVGHFICNIGNQMADMFGSTTHHPVYGKSLYKLSRNNSDGSTRIEQLGQSWLFHGLFALSNNFCCTDCQPTDGTHIGIHCTDINTATRSGSQGGPECGPKWQVNPVTGAFPYPPANPPFSGPVARRLQAHISDLVPSGPDTSYFVEGLVIAADDALAGNGNNNASYRPATLTGSDGAWSLALTGTTVREFPAIYAWAAADPAVRVKEVDVPGDGRFIVAGCANAVPGSIGVWHYEYAVYNLNSARAARAISIALCANVSAANAGFHDVEWHDGDGPGNVNYDGTDWTFADGGGVARWETQTAAENPSANALRWGTLYNYRFDAQAPPIEDEVTLELFGAGTPAEASARALPVPGFRTGDLNGDGIADLHDLAEFLGRFGFCAGDSNFEAMADFDRDGCITLSDLSLILAKFGQ